uniref:Uncharacterized protein n=1 Tax=Staphylococcus haemolyticus TaxID=1283 RepID=A0A1B1UY72_STAHA|nr:hypothetical protein [Staphylococcus haemolyticus]
MEKVIESLIQKINETRTNYDKAFISIGNTNIKAYVKIIKNTTNMKYQLMKQINNYKKQTGSFPKWIKVDIVTLEESISFNEVERLLINTRRNYVDFGLALDKQWQIVFLPDEINANAFVRPSKKDKSLKEIAENNITHF